MFIVYVSLPPLGGMWSQVYGLGLDTDNGDLGRGITLWSWQSVADLGMICPVLVLNLC